MAERGFGYEEFGLGVLLGFLLGGGVGLLMAPQSGADTRDRIAHKAGDIRDSAADLVDQAKHSIEQAADKVEGLFGAKDKNIKQKLEELRADLEKYSLEQV